MANKLIDFLGIFIGFRKFFVMTLIIVISLILLIFKILTGSEWVDLMKSTLIAFFASNGIENFTAAAKSWLSNKTQLTEDESK